MKSMSIFTGTRKRTALFLAFLLLLLTAGSVFTGCAKPEESSSESESETETETETEYVPDLPEYEIIDSVWRESPGYSWRDMYIILQEITRTSPHLLTETTGNTIFKMRYTRIPLFFVGGHNIDTDEDEFHLFICENSKVFDLMTVKEHFMYNAKTDALLLPSDPEYCYYYTPHVLLKVKNEEPLSSYQEIPFMTFSGETWYTTDDNIDSQVIDLYQEAQDEVE